MIKIYSMNTCPDCIYVEEQIQGDDRYEIIDIGSHVKYLAFITNWTPLKKGGVLTFLLNTYLFTNYHYLLTCLF